MKESYYNYYIHQETIVLFYNSFSNAYLVLDKKKINPFFCNNKLNLSELKNDFPNIFITLKDNGFIVDMDVDEIVLYENLCLRRRFSKSNYDLTINPTLDCNLKCWYCYESHIPKSKMSNEILESIINHLKYKLSIEPFESLNLKFFGGEPLLRPQIIIKLIEKIKELSKEYIFKIYIHFTTNGTVITKSLLEKLKDCNVSFQITIDGNIIDHNAIRIRKIDGKGTYHSIIENIKRINAELKSCFINVRINFSNETFVQLESLIHDLDFCDRKKTVLSLHKVWQVDGNSINKSRLFEFIRYANKKKFLVSYMEFNNRLGVVCYADMYNQAVINYDGKVFKCTARDFIDKHSEGVLTKEGIINWKTDKLMDRLNIRIANNCKRCKLLPSCPGICTQNRLESKNEILCALTNDFTMQDYIIHNFNNKMIKAKIKT